MRRLTLRLPDSLHRQLQNLALNEGVSLNQYILNALTRHVAHASSVLPVPENAVVEQRAAYTALLQNLGEASFDQIQDALSERETVSPEAGLSTEVVDRIKRRVSGKNP
jgi:predicted HicB family RNase H-like nuclease